MAQAAVAVKGRRPTDKWSCCVRDSTLRISRVRQQEFHSDGALEF